METRKEKLTGREIKKKREVGHFSEDTENIRMKGNSGLHGHYFFAGSREKENFYSRHLLFLEY